MRTVDIQTVNKGVLVYYFDVDHLVFNFFIPDKWHKNICLLEYSGKMKM